MTAASAMTALLDSRPRQYSLPREFYADADFYELDLKGIYERQWVFAGARVRDQKPRRLHGGDDRPELGRRAA